MSDFVHHDLGHLRQGDVVQVELASSANVHLLDSVNFQRYCNGASFDSSAASRCARRPAWRSRTRGTGTSRSTSAARRGRSGPRCG